MVWARMLAYITGTVDQELLLRNEYLAAENPYGKKTHLRFQGREVPPTEGSCRSPLIVLQQTTQSFLATRNSVVPAHSSIRQVPGLRFR
jgi:hypothetical protein